MVIKKADRSHIDELEVLYNELNDYLASTVNYPGWIKHIYPTRDTVITGVEEQSLFIAQIDSSIVGSIILNHTPEEAYNGVKWLVPVEYKDVLVLRTLAVHPSFLKRNIASSLIKFAKQYAIREKVRSIRLDVSVENIPAITLYEKAGFRFVGTVDLGLPYEHLKWFRLYELPI